MYRMYSSCQSERGSTHRCPVSAHTPQACTIQKGSGSKRDQNIFSTGILQREMRKWCNGVGEGGGTEDVLGLLCRWRWVRAAAAVQSCDSKDSKARTRQCTYRAVGGLGYELGVVK